MSGFIDQIHHFYLHISQSKKHKTFQHSSSICCLIFWACFCHLHLNLVLHLWQFEQIGAEPCFAPAPAPVPISPGFPPQTSPPIPEPRERGPSQLGADLVIRVETAEGIRWPSPAVGQRPSLKQQRRRSSLSTSTSTA